MKIKAKFRNKSAKEMNMPSKLNRYKSARPNMITKDLNNIINVNKFRIPLENISTELKDIKKIIEDSENQNEKEDKKEDKILIKKTNIKIAKENIIMSLRKELKFQKLLNRNLLNFKEYADKNSSSYKKNYEDICKYKEQLHSDLSEFIKVCDNYEKMQKEYESEKNTIIKTNENLINYKKEEQKKMKSRLEKLNYDTQNQHNTIEKLRNTLREFRNQNNDYILNLEKNEYDHDVRYEMLLNEYKRVENQYKYYYDLEVRSRKNNLDRMNKNLLAEEEGIAVAKLNDKQVRGEFLRNVIRDIQSQIKEIENLNKKMREDKEIEKLLGKRGAEKFKERMTEKYNNEMSNIHSKYNFTFTSI
jgi:hypothetical protein